MVDQFPSHTSDPMAAAATGEPQHDLQDRELQEVDGY
jgi:hypothetical protein